MDPTYGMNRKQAWVLVIGFLLIVFGVSGAQALLEGFKGQRPYATELFLHKPVADQLRKYESGLENKSWMASTLRPFMQYVHFALLREGGADVLLGHDGWLYYRPGTRYLIERGHAGEIDHAANAILRFRDQLAERGIALIVAPTPSKDTIYPDHLSARASDPSAFHGPTSALVKRLRDAGVEVVDVAEVLRTARTAPDAANQPALYLKQDTHWTPAGMDLTVNAVAERILAIPGMARGTVAFDRKPAPVERPGDLVKLTHSPLIEQQFKAENVPCEQIVRKDTGELYKDDPVSPVLVIGDSFLRIYHQDEPKFAGFVAHLAMALNMPITSIINDGGASTLVRQELSRKPKLLEGKRVVVWEFVERDVRFGTEGWQEVPLPPAASANAGA